MSIACRSSITLLDREQPLFLAVPTPGNPGSIVSFEKAAEWLDFVEGLAADARIPDIVAAKFERARTLYLLGWVDPSVIKAGELAALIALEMAVLDRYSRHVSKKRRNLAGLLKYMVASDGLTDAEIPMVARCGGTAVGQLTGKTRPTLAERRNALAHGDPFEGHPTGGLLELVRDLINFAYRDYIAARLAALPPSAGYA